MKRIIVHRNGIAYGPYTEAQLTHYLHGNKLLLNDLAQIEGSAETVSLAKAMKTLGWKVPSAKNPLECFKQIGLDFVIPVQAVCSLAWTKDLKFLYLSAIGLVPLLIVMFSRGSFAYIALAAYFSASVISDVKTLFN